MPVAKRLFVVEEHKNPSTDYFIAPYLRELGVSPVYCAFSQVPPPEQLQGAAVIFVRYVPANWRAQVERCRDRIASVYFFMDDDLFDWRAFAAMPLRYQKKILRLSWSRRKWLGVGRRAAAGLYALFATEIRRLAAAPACTPPVARAAGAATDLVLPRLRFPQC